MIFGLQAAEPIFQIREVLVIVMHRVLSSLAERLMKE